MTVTESQKDMTLGHILVTLMSYHKVTSQVTVTACDEVVI